MRVCGMLEIMVEGPWITPPPPGLLTGAEVIAGASATVRDFWAWALSNLRSNAVRGMLAEYLVACAVGSRGRPRVDWDAYDVLTPRQERIEVKSAAYLQAWEQRRESAIIFRGLRARSWNPREGYSGGPSYNADVYVFAVLTATEHVGATGGHAGAVTTTWSPVIRVPARRVLVLVANFSGPRPGAPPDLVTSLPTLWGRPLPHNSGMAPRCGLDVVYGSLPCHFCERITWPAIPPSQGSPSPSSPCRSCCCSSMAASIRWPCLAGRLVDGPSATAAAWSSNETAPCIAFDDDPRFDATRVP